MTVVSRAYPTRHASIYKMYISATQPAIECLVHYNELNRHCGTWSWLYPGKYTACYVQVHPIRQTVNTRPLSQLNWVKLKRSGHIAKFFSEPFGNKRYFSYFIDVKAVPWDLKTSEYCTKCPLFRVHAKPQYIASSTIYSGPSYPPFIVL